MTFFDEAYGQKTITRIIGISIGNITFNPIFSINVNANDDAYIYEEYDADGDDHLIIISSTFTFAFFCLVLLKSSGISPDIDHLISATFTF